MTSNRHNQSPPPTARRPGWAPRPGWATLPTRALTLAALATVGVLTLAAGPARAGDVPSRLAVQATLLTGAGTPASGTFTITLRLYPTATAASATWTETHTGVVVTGGLLDVALGSVVALPPAILEGTSEAWLGVTVNAEPELSRARLRSVAYAHHARAVDTADTAAALACSGCVTLGSLGFDPATQAELDTHTAATAAHHARFADAEAVAAMGAKGPANPLNHDRYTAAEAVAAMGAKADTNPLHHDHFGAPALTAAMGTKADDNPLQHDRFTDAEVVAALGSTLTSLDGKAGGTVTGNVAVTDGLWVDGAKACTTAGNCTGTGTLAQLDCADGQMVKSSGGSWQCSDDEQLTPTEACAGADKALQWDGVAFVCVTLDQDAASKVTDSWGFDWDSDERPLATWQQAFDNCAAQGGRLPTITELYRVNFVSGTGQVGKTYTASPLWAIIEWKAGYHATVRLDNGTVSNSVDTTVRTYRCVWPGSSDGWFSGDDCYGPAGSGCWTAKGELNRYSMDKYDRPAVIYNAASRECAFYGGHLPSERDYAEEIQRGLPYGSNQWQWTSDWSRDGSTLKTGIVRWNGIVTAFTDYYSTYATWSTRDLTTVRRFRCRGVRYDAGSNPQELEALFEGDSTHLKIEEADLATSAFGAAQSACWAKGGHLPTGRDYHELVADGLTNGSSSWMWTSDQAGGTATYAAVVRWGGVAPSFDASSSTYASTGTKAYTTGGGYKVRCVYYPVDQEYAGPSSCNGGCFVSTKAGGATLWMDSTDRPLAEYKVAVRTCNYAGGHLATERDLTELIRSGLPNGTNAWVFTSDQEGYNGTNFLVGLVRWTGTGTTAFLDTYSTYASWGYKSASTSYKRVYRCMWTNELR